MQISNWKNVAAHSGCWHNFILRIFSLLTFGVCFFFGFIVVSIAPHILFFYFLGQTTFEDWTLPTPIKVELNISKDFFKEFLVRLFFSLPPPPSPGESIVRMNILFFTHARVIEVVLCNDGQCFAANREKASPSWSKDRFCVRLTRRLCIERAKKNGIKMTQSTQVKCKFLLPYSNQR